MSFIQRFNGFKSGVPGRLALFLAVFALSFVSGTDLRAGSKPPEIALRFFLQAGQGMPREQVVPVNLVDPPQVVYLKKLPELTEKHIESIQKTPEGQIVITFNSVGANLLEGFTRSNMGAVMVVICNGRVIYAPVIDMPLASGRIVLPGGITDQEVMILQKTIARRNR